jgi:manganese oxidase
MNKGTNPATMHPHGVQYDKANEGAFYKYGTSKGDDVQPGETFEYTVSVFTLMHAAVRFARMCPST